MELRDLIRKYGIMLKKSLSSFLERKCSFSERMFRFLILVLPICLFFSYYPVISLGNSEAMNLELSLSIIWLVVFDVFGFFFLTKNGLLFSELKGMWWVWILFPVWVTLTVIWSVNVVRGILTAGILWLIVFAGYVVFCFRELFDNEFRIKWLRMLFYSTLFVCGWCVLQCVLDLMGVGRDYSLMCDGCTYKMFGFPHPNGFSIEPQFMGNLLLAPGMAAVWLLLKKCCKNDNDSDFLDSRFLWFCFFIIVVTMFLTFSRGAIYAFLVGLLFISGWVLTGKMKEKRNTRRRLFLIWGMMVFSFLFTLNLQGIMTEISPTNDGYFDGVSRVLNHLSLGVIDVRNRDNPVEKPVENFQGDREGGGDSNDAVFDGYVAQSTDTRVKLTSVAVKAWSGSVSTMMFGVGIGGAGQALYDNGLILSPKEIVQNEYASLLLETGLFGISLFGLTLVLITKIVRSKKWCLMIFGLLVAYGVSLLFFSGFPNALQIYLLPIVLVFI